jgi:hypothetical protein
MKSRIIQWRIKILQISLARNSLVSTSFDRDHRTNKIMNVMFFAILLALFYEFCQSTIPKLIRQPRINPCLYSQSQSHFVMNDDDFFQFDGSADRFTHHSPDSDIWSHCHLHAASKKFITCKTFRFCFAENGSRCFFF